MKIVIDKNKVLSTRMKHILPRVNSTYHARMRRITGEHYRFLTYMSWQFTNASFLDLGSRGGMSAICLADNPSNKITSVDITDEFRKQYPSNFSSYSNINFIIERAQDYQSSFYDNFDLILLDIDHSGHSEKKILDKINQSKFSGILIMDDINYNKFKELKVVWSKIERPKRILEYAHHSGTGIISYGMEIEYID